jgi:hypothetical protein
MVLYPPNSLLNCLAAVAWKIDPRVIGRAFHRRCLQVEMKATRSDRSYRLSLDSLMSLIGLISPICPIALIGPIRPIRLIQGECRAREEAKGGYFAWFRYFSRTS